MKLLLVTFCISSFSLFSQDGWKDSNFKEFEAMIQECDAQLEKGDPYSVKSVYTFYEDLTTETPKLTSSAFLISDGKNNIYMSQFGRYMVQNAQLNVVCDTAQKVIIINDPQEAYLTRTVIPEVQELQAIGYEVKKKADGPLVKYYLGFPEGAKYLGAEVWQNKLKQVDCYILYTAQEILDDSQGDDVYIRPRMEIKFSDYRRGNSVDLKKMKKSDEFISVNGGEVTLSTSYSTYKLIDLRTSND